tara:strand:- start:82 stop:363 length:282 start_codon:yes stop_codon:yes gene_type:complete
MKEKDRLELQEELAAYAHEAWSSWMKYMFGKTKHITNEVTLDNQPATLIMMPTELYDRWHYQMQTAYEDLPEEMKPSDRDEAEKILAIALDFI